MAPVGGSRDRRPAWFVVLLPVAVVVWCAAATFFAVLMLVYLQPACAAPPLTSEQVGHARILFGAAAAVSAGLWCVVTVRLRRWWTALLSVLVSAPFEAVTVLGGDPTWWVPFCL